MIDDLRRHFARFMVAALAAALGILSAPALAADRSGQVRVDGIVRTYSIHVPDRARPPGGFPVILAFHGGGMDGARMKRLTQFDGLADQRGFIVIYPDGTDKHWNDGRSTIRNKQDDVRFVSLLLDQVEGDHAVDRARVFATGISNGALFAERLGCELSRRIAAIAPVAGTMPRDLAPGCRPARPVAVLQIDGTADPIMPYNGGGVADFGGRGEGGQVLSVADTAALWARLNGCGPRGTPQALAPLAPLDQTKVVRMAYQRCHPNGAVTVLTVVGGGHAWPGGSQYAPRRFIGLVSQQIDASRMTVDFFLSQPASR